MFFPQPPMDGFTGGPENTFSSEASRVARVIQWITPTFKRFASQASS